MTLVGLIAQLGEDELAKGQSLVKKKMQQRFMTWMYGGRLMAKIC